MNWIKEFETKFNIEKYNDDVYRIIIGERPYKQQLNNSFFRVDVNRNLRNIYYNKSNEENNYWNFGQVAFLVNNWVKIQDSLEMVFNMLTGCSITSLKILSYLRENAKEITAQKFAKYLFQKHNLILINKYKFNKANSTYESTKKDLFSFIANYGFDENAVFKFLFVGNNKFARGLPDKSKIGYILHSSGYNLNTRNVEYYNTWFQLDDDLIKSSSKKVDKPSFSDFKVLKDGS